MKPRKPPPEQDDLLRARLVEMIDMRHELVKLADLIDWEVFEREWAGFFPSQTGRPATPTRVVAGLLYLQHAFRLSDEAVVARWVENPYWQHFCGETFFLHRLPIDPSSMTRWRNRIGEEGVEWLLTETIKAGQRAGAVQDDHLRKVTVDTTVMEKNIAHPTDARLYERARRKLVGLAREAGIDLRQNYNRLGPRLSGQVGRYAHARQFKRMSKTLRRLKGYSHVEDRVEHVAQACGAGSARGLGCWHEGRDQCPFGVCQIACILVAHSGMLASGEFGPGHRDLRSASYPNRSTTC